MATKTTSYTIEESCISLLTKERFYAVILSKLAKIPLKGSQMSIPTAGVGFNSQGKLTLYYNEEWLLSMPLEKIQGVLIHEILHVFFRHMTRFPEMMSKDTEPHLKQLMNLATDMAINQYIPKEHLPEFCVFPKYSSPDGKLSWDFPLDKNAEFYFEELKKLKWPKPPTMKIQMGKGQKGEGKDKSEGQGQSDPNDPNSMDNHEMWVKVVDENGKEVDASELGIDVEFEVQRTVLKSIKECKDYGKLPSFVQKEIDLILAKERHNWKRELRVFVNSVLSVAKRLSQKRVNKRFEDSPFFLPGKKKARRPKLLVARDTSGSVFDDKVQAEFLNEMINISKYCDVIVADCDTEVHQVYNVSKPQDFKSYKGGGGTSFKPIFKLARDKMVDGIIYLTDTYGEFPEAKEIGKFGSKTIWVTFSQDKVEVPFGRHVNIQAE